jgi:glycerophosphoryl diester phosphodiesterase
MKPAFLFAKAPFRPLITAHAGCMGTVPNSRESIEAAFSSGADIVEVDVRATRDGVAVLAHDESLDLRNGGKALVRDLSWKELQGSAILPPGGMLRLESLFSLVGGLGVARAAGKSVLLNLDIKEVPALPAAGALVQDRDMADAVVFSGLDRAGIEAAREELPGLRYFFNADEVLPLAGASDAQITAACSLALEYGCCGINLEWTRASFALMVQAGERKIPIALWTVDREEDMRVALAYGPDSVTTNRPDLLAALMGRSG